MQYFELKDSRCKGYCHIGGIKEFKLLRGDFPLLRNDIIDHVFTVCSVLVNLLGVMVSE